MSRREKMVDIAVSIANDDSHGYSQYRRFPWQGSDFDCSSLMYWSAHEAGYDVPLSGYTGTMLADFQAAGFTAVPWDGNIWDCDPGDILLAHNDARQHTEMYVGNGNNVGAHIAETGDIDGAPGDQTGNEISVAPNWGAWDYVLIPPKDDGAGQPAPAPTPAPAPAKAEPKGVRYCVKSGGEWNADMIGTHDTGGSSDTFAGVLGTPITMLAVEGRKYRVMTRDSFPKWLPWVTKFDKGDEDAGCAGDGSYILEVQVRGCRVSVHRDGEWDGVIDAITIQ